VAWVPTDVAGLALWLDANDIATLFTDSGGTTQDFVRLTQARDLALTFALDAAGAAQ
jgi:hypothetical protein